MTKFEERLWSLIRNFVELGHNNPAMLVAAVRIVEIQEMVDKQLESSGRGIDHSIMSKTWTGLNFVEAIVAC